MNIEKYADAIHACRFCFMCRHLSAIGNVTFTEADTPRVRASMLHGVALSPEKLTNPDLAKTMYRADLSGCCRRNCVNHYDEVGLVLACRADLVDAGAVPENIRAIAEDLKKMPEWTISGKGDVVYVADGVSEEAGAAAAFAKLVGGKVKTARGGSCGKGLWVLGFRKDAKAVAAKFVRALESSKASVVVVSHPAIYDLLVNTLPEMGLKLKLRVMHSSEYLADVRTSRKLGSLHFIESDFLRNYNGDYAYPKSLLKANGARFKPFGTNDEESYSCAECALLLDRIEPELVKLLAKYVEARAEHPEKDVFAVASPYTKIQLKKYTSLDVRTIEELLADAL